ncbi:hypothetical protein [Actinomyces sp. zg328]|uniref:hypothetical protein n=1 Tax=Actinomyces sp. zg328 TaxID=2609287 RepID=UPI0019160BC1|nr:hypothetical protein [Actinomyces sp. zg328]
MTEFIDPRLAPKTGLLRNKVGERTKIALDEAEGGLSFARLIQLIDHPANPTNFGKQDLSCGVVLAGHGIEDHR